MPARTQARRARARSRHDGELVVNGSKIFITNAGTDITACVTITALTADGEVSNVIVPNGTPGYEISAPMHKLGWHASDTRELSFKDCRVPAGNLLGERGKGFQQFMDDPRRRAHLGRVDGRRALAGRIRPRVRLCPGAAAVRQADLEVPGDPVPARRHGDGDRGGAPARLPRRLAQGRAASRSRSPPRRRSSTPACSRTVS